MSSRAKNSDGGSVPTGRVTYKPGLARGNAIESGLVGSKPPEPAKRERQTIPDFLRDVIVPDGNFAPPTAADDTPKCPGCGARLTMWRGKRATCQVCGFAVVVRKP